MPPDQHNILPGSVRVVHDTEEGTAAGIYGIIVSAAVMAASHLPSAAATVVAVLGTLVIYWAAERYARVIAERIHEGRRPSLRRLRRAARYGLDGREAYSIERRIQRLEYRIHREARDGNNWRGGYYGRGGWDRDRDGFDDRYERDRGTNYDEDRNPD